ncbi:MAG: cadherin-like domain-containing protein, partial [Gammaproteobacteria bacterium]
DSFGAGAAVTSVTQGTSGAVIFLADGTVTYTPSTDFNGTDSFTYTVTTAASDTETATVNVTVNAVNDAPTGGVFIDNPAPEEGDVLTASNTLADVEGISGPVSYQWFRNGVAISGATAQTYTTVAADMNTVITVVASYTDGQGTIESVSSAATQTVKQVSETGDAIGNITEFPTDEDDPSIVEPEAVTIDLSKDEATVSYLADIDDEGGAGHNEPFIVPDYDQELYQDEPRTASFLSHVTKPVIGVVADITEEMLQLFDLVRIKMAEASDKPEGLFANSIGSISLTLSVGLVTWVMRGGSVAVSLLSSMTMLSKFDPLPLVAMRRKGKKGMTPDDNSEDAEVDGMFDNEEGETGSTNTEPGEEDQS